MVKNHILLLLSQARIRQLNSLAGNNDGGEFNDTDILGSNIMKGQLPHKFMVLMACFLLVPLSHSLKQFSLSFCICWILFFSFFLFLYSIVIDLLSQRRVSIVFLHIIIRQMNSIWNQSIISQDTCMKMFLLTWKKECLVVTGSNYLIETMSGISRTLPQG